MVIVLFVGLVLVAVLATFLHRRHRRRVEAAENLGPRPDLGVWGPNQHSVHDVRSFGSPAPAVPDTEKGKGKIKDSSRLGSGSGSKKLKKGVFGRMRG